MTDDEFAAHEQLADSELGSLHRGLDNGTLDTSNVIRMRSRNSGDTTDRITIRLPISMIGRISDQCGTGKLFTSVNVFGQHSFILGLQWAATHKNDDPLRDPVIAEMMLNDIIARRNRISETIDKCEWELRGARGATRERILTILLAQRDAAAADEDVELASRASRILEKATEL